MKPLHKEIKIELYRLNEESIALSNYIADNFKMLIL